MCGRGERLDDLETPAMLERGNAGAGGAGGGRVDLGHHDARLDIALGEDPTPRIDHEGVPEGVAAVLVVAALRRREDVAAVLDGARAIEDVPMRLAGLLGERRRDRQERAAG